MCAAQSSGYGKIQKRKKSSAVSRRNGLTQTTVPTASDSRQTKEKKEPVKKQKKRNIFCLSYITLKHDAFATTFFTVLIITGLFLPMRKVLVLLNDYSGCCHISCQVQRCRLLKILLTYFKVQKQFMIKIFSKLL